MRLAMERFAAAAWSGRATWARAPPRSAGTSSGWIAVL